MITKRLLNVFRRVPAVRDQLAAELKGVDGQVAALREELAGIVAERDDAVNKLKAELPRLNEELAQVRAAKADLEAREIALQQRASIGVFGDVATVERKCSEKCRPLHEQLAELAKARAELTE